MISLFENILQIAALSSAMIIFVLVIRKLFHNKLNIKIISLLWLLVLARLIMSITFDSPVNLGEMFPATQDETTASADSSPAHTINNTENDNSAAHETSENAALQPETNAVQTPKINDTAEPKTSCIKNYFNNLDIMQILSYIWLSGVILIFFVKSLSMIRFGKKICGSRPIDDENILRMMNANKINMKILRRVSIHECDYIDAPLTCGVIFPKILIPAGFISSLDEDKQNLIILHELCHIKNFDVAKNYLWLVSKIIYWFNPLLSYAYKAYIQDTELNCDSMVLSNFESDHCRLYSQSLIDVIKLSKGEMRLPVALSFCEDRSNLRKRVEYMIKPTKKKGTVSIITLVLAAVLAFACFTTACVPRANAYEIEFSDETIHVDYEIEPEENVRVSINADVAYPIKNSLPISGIEPTNITAEQLLILVDYVMVDTPVYYSNPYYIDSEHSNGDLFDGTIVPLDEYQSTFTNIKAFTPDEKESYFQLMQSPSGNSSLIYWRFDDGHEWDAIDYYRGVDIDNMEKSYDECLQIAEDLIEVLVGKNNNFQVYDTLIHTSTTVNPAYRFYFKRFYNGIPRAHYSSFFAHTPSEDYTSLTSEYIFVIVDDEGVFEVQWSGKTKKTGIIEKNVQLTDFDTIMQAFDEYCINNFDWTLLSMPEDEKIISVDVNIASIELYYLPIAEYNEATDVESTVKLPYELTPVWNFRGDITIYRETIDGDAIDPIECRQVNVITINALDGTIYK